MNTFGSDPEAIRSLYQTIDTLEDQFFQSLPDQIKKKFEADGLILQNLNSSGEIVFLLLGLKPAVLFENFSPELFEKYLENVIVPSGLLSKCPELEILQFGAPVSTESGCDLSSKRLLCNKAHKLYSKILALIEATQLQCSDRSLAETVLDYPVPLDSSWYDQITEVGYEDKLSGKLLTTFAIPRSVLQDLVRNASASSEASPVMAHFLRYKTKSSGIFALRLVFSE